MNEILFFTHIAVVLAFLLFALKMGKYALYALVCIQVVLANLFVLKQIPLFGLVVTCSDVYVVGAFLGLNLLQEYFGKQEAKNCSKISFFGILLFLAMSQMHLFYQPSVIDTTQVSYQTVLSSMPRIVIASLAVFFVVQRFDILFFAKLQTWIGKKHLGKRVAISLTLSQLVDTALFTYLGLYGLIQSPFQVMVLSFAIKAILILLNSSFIAFCKRWFQPIAELT